MPNKIDITTIDFNTGGSGYSSDFKIDDPTTWPNGACTLPDLLPLDLPTLNNDFTTLNSDCKYNFPNILPIPPVFIPTPEINLPCPTGYTFNSNVSFTATGCTTFGGNLGIVADPSQPCGYTLQGGIVLDVPCAPCPDGMSFTGAPSISVRGNGASTLGPTGEVGPITFQLTGGPCNYTIVGGGTIVLPKLPPMPQVGNDRPGTCLDCTASCDEIAAAIEASYTGSTIPMLGDIIDLCVFTYEVVGNPQPATTCPTSHKVVVFTVSAVDYTARMVSTTCPVMACPFDMTVTEDSGTLYVNFVAGTVNGLIPDNLFSTLTTTYTSGATVFAYASCTTDGTVVTDVTLTLSTTPPTEQLITAWSAPLAFTQLLGIIQDKDPLRSISCMNLTFAPVYYTSIPKAPVVPNEIPYDNYYYWAPTNGSG
jgi:hypothetical protein